MRARVALLAVLTVLLCAGGTGPTADLFRPAGQDGILGPVATGSAWGAGAPGARANVRQVVVDTGAGLVFFVATDLTAP